MRILLVDDEEIIRFSIPRILRRKGYEVVTASDGREALAVLERDRDIDMVLTDFKMPGMSGVELCETIKETWPGLALVVMTGFAAEAEVTQLKALGVLEILYKPVDINTLLALSEKIGIPPM